jgi:protein-disulfide isomerase
MRSRKLTLPVTALLIVLSIVLLTSSLVVTGEPLEQQIPQATVDAAVAALFAQTATAQAHIGATQTIQAAFDQALTATVQAGSNAAKTQQAAVSIALTATAQPPTSQLFAILTQVVSPEASATVPATELDLSAIPQERAEDGGFVIGEPTAPITIIEFGDFGCPHCQRYQPEIDQFLVDFVMTGQAKFEYRVFPTAGGDLTVFAGQLLECAEAYQPGAFWEGYQLMIEYAEDQYTVEIGQLLAEDLDLSYRDLLECTQGANQVQVDVALGIDLGVTGTPAIMVRYQDGDPQFIDFGGTKYDRGAVPLNILEAVVQNAQPDIN